ncbi:hypothetical protein QR98_0029700 [Sarcoptes scabiei]|uniref:Uncharacterized protein n=1 Tax=Sarcoptes scabiei TaxID=52283 RepID=A0A132A0U0_SARSC|nr:hypothetical protein QR98_0029700 [Sarcoptes scabiei]
MDHLVLIHVDPRTSSPMRIENLIDCLWDNSIRLDIVEKSTVISHCLFAALMGNGIELLDFVSGNDFVAIRAQCDN